jgi:S-methylmethionine-dependent homocysteine/selenocysteine methylase
MPRPAVIKEMKPLHRDHLPPLDGDLFLTDGGLETFLIFDRGLDLPEFAAFDLLKDESGRNELRDYYRPYLDLAARNDVGFILESPTWRANPRWGAAVGYDEPGVARANREAIALLEELRQSAEGDRPVLISGCVGPHDDGYSPSEILDAEEAHAYHAVQVGTISETAADLVTAITMTYAEEAMGVARAASAVGMPVVISFTVETDGRLPSGQALGDAIEQVDADPASAVAYFMINCAHPTHFDSLVETGDPWLGRVQGLRANASRMSHAELDESTELDDGDPDDLAARYASMRERLPMLNVLGGCCGTDHRHVTRICSAVIG